MKANKVRVVRGEAKVKGRSQNGIEIECAGETFYAVNLLLCTDRRHSCRPFRALRRPAISS